MEEELVIKNGFRTPSFMTSPANYTESEIITMQQDAVKRVNEMRQQAMRHINVSEEDTNVIEPINTIELPQNQQNLSQVEENIIKEELTQPIEPINDNIMQPTINSLTGIFDKLDLDSEKIILIGLMLLLMNEGSDNTLLMALGYILL